MSTLAPTVSQTLAAHHRLGNALATFCTVDSSSTDAKSANTGATNTGDHTSAQHWQACAYCGLLAHVPVLPGAVVPFAVTLAVVRAVVAPASHAVRAPLVHTAAQPRAPPVFS